MEFPSPIPIPQVTAWLSDNEGNFKASVDDGAVLNKGSVKAYVQSEMHAFLQVPASTGTHTHTHTHTHIHNQKLTDHTNARTHTLTRPLL